MKIINKIATAKFRISTPDVSSSELELDFNPIIEQFSLPITSKNYQLIHWQGRPKGVREWGIYDAASDTYRCGVWENTTKFAYGGVKLLMLDDKTAVTLPSAVIYFTGSGLPSGDSP